MTCRIEDGAEYARLRTHAYFDAEGDEIGGAPFKIDVQQSRAAAVVTSVDIFGPCRRLLNLTMEFLQRHLFGRRYLMIFEIAEIYRGSGAWPNCDAILATMPTNAERFYRRMNSVRALRQLIGQAEDADFDCKRWPERSDAARGILAKAACGFTNATGGVIVIGLSASGCGADNPDVVQSLTPVDDRSAVASEALDIILKFVEPGMRE